MIVGGKMFNSSHDPARLHASDICYSSFRCEVRVFAHVFIIAAAQGGTIDVDTRSEHDADTSGPGIIADALPYTPGDITVP